MDNVTVSHRCLWDVTQLARNEWRTVGDNAHGRQVRVASKDSVQGYQWRTKQLRPMDLFSPSTADFTGYATRWERRYSVLSSERSGRLSFVPVVDHTAFFAYNLPLPAKFGGGTMSSFPVVAHYGTVGVADIIVLQKYATTRVSTERVKALESILDQGDAYVEEGYPGGAWGPFAHWDNVGPNYFTVLTDLEGRILANLGSFGSERGLESEDPLDYIMLGQLTADLLKGAGKIVFGLARRGAKKAIVSLAKRTLTKELEEDIGSAAAKRIAEKLAQRSTEYVRRSGITPRHFKAFQDAARETNLVAVVRNGNEVAIPLIEKGCPGKPKIFEPFNTSKSTAILTATTAADKELVLKSKYILISDSKVAVRRLPNGAMEQVELQNPFWQLEPGQVIDPALKKPVVGDYDLMGVFSPDNPGQNIALHSVAGEKLKNMTSPLVDKLSQAVNTKFDMARVLHGAQDQYAGFRKGATAFFPDGVVVYMETEEEVKALYDAVGRQPITGSYRR
jgi:hypothetical protein